MFIVINAPSSSFPVDNVTHRCLDVFLTTSLDASDVAVAHQCHFITVDSYDAMDNIPALFNPCQDDIANLRFCRFLQQDTVFPANDERQHAPSFDRQRDADAFLDKFDGLLDDLDVF